MVNSNNSKNSKKDTKKGNQKDLKKQQKNIKPLSARQEQKLAIDFIASHPMTKYLNDSIELIKPTEYQEIFYALTYIKDHSILFISRAKNFNCNYTELIGDVYAKIPELLKTRDSRTATAIFEVLDDIKNDFKNMLAGMFPGSADMMMGTGAYGYSKEDLEIHEMQNDFYSVEFDPCGHALHLIETAM